MAFIMKKTPENPEAVIRCLTDVCSHFYIYCFSSNQEEQHSIATL